MVKPFMLTVLLLLQGCTSADVHNLNADEQDAVTKLLIHECQKGLGVEGGYTPVLGSFFTAEADSLPESRSRLSHPIRSLIVVIPKFTGIATRAQTKDRLIAVFDTAGAVVEDSTFLGRIFNSSSALFVEEFELGHEESPTDPEVLVLALIPTKMRRDRLTSNSSTNQLK